MNEAIYKRLKVVTVYQVFNLVKSRIVFSKAKNEDDVNNEKYIYQHVQDKWQLVCALCDRSVLSCSLCVICILARSI